MLLAPNELWRTGATSQAGRFKNSRSGVRKASLIDALAKKLPRNLAEDLVNEFVALRQDLRTNTLGRSSQGKFVETVVQVCQFLDTNQYDDPPPKPDNYFNTLESKAPHLDDGLQNLYCTCRQSDVHAA